MFFSIIQLSNQKAKFFLFQSLFFSKLKKSCFKQKFLKKSIDILCKRLHNRGIKYFLGGNSYEVMAKNYR